MISLLLAVGLASSACSQDDSDEGARATRSTSTTSADSCDVVGGSTEPQATTTVQATLTEYAISAVPQTVSSGGTEFVAVNEGLAPHEMFILRYDGDPATIPLNMVGGADLAQLPEEAVAGRFRFLTSGQRCTATFDLSPGSYALICNLVDDGSNPHYSRGMVTGFTVT